MQANEEKTCTFVTLFDSLGFECIINVSRYEQKRLLQDLGGPKAEQINWNTLLLRARFNQHRNAEVWAFESTLTEKELWEYSQEEPQVLADTIRQMGRPLYVEKKPKGVIV